jgi:hypothetical protein
MTHNFSQNTIETKKCLVVVSAKEHGIIYLLVDGQLKELEHVDKHPLSYSDNEGFFFRTGSGKRLGSGAPLEVDKQHNIKRYIKAIGEELNEVIKTEKPEVIFLFEPEHLKGLVEEYLVNSTHIPVQTIEHGNFVHEAPHEIMARMEKYMSADDLDPADPASVEGEPNAEEKRKILEVGKKLDGG